MPEEVWDTMHLSPVTLCGLLLCDWDISLDPPHPWLEFGDLFKTTHSFTNICKDKPHGLAFTLYTVEMGLKTPRGVTQYFSSCSAHWRIANTVWSCWNANVCVRSLKMKLDSLGTRGTKRCLFQLFRGRQQKRRQAAAVHTAAVNAAVSRSPWKREQSDNRWELLVGAGDLEWMAWCFYHLTATQTHRNAAIPAFMNHYHWICSPSDRMLSPYLVNVTP